jgi:hypothetical protein
MGVANDSDHGDRCAFAVLGGDRDQTHCRGWNQNLARVTLRNTALLDFANHHGLGNAIAQPLPFC